MAKCLSPSDPTRPPWHLMHGVTNSPSLHSEAGTVCKRTADIRSGGCNGSAAYHHFEMGHTDSVKRICPKLKETEGKEDRIPDEDLFE